MKLISALILATALPLFAQSEKVIFESPFKAGEGKSKVGEKWEIGHGVWTVNNSTITGKENKEDGHAAGVKARIEFPDNFKFDFEFCLDGAKKINVRFIQDGKKVFIINLQTKKYRFQIEKGEGTKKDNFLTAAEKDFAFEKGKWYKGSLTVKKENYSLQIAGQKAVEGANKLITTKKNLVIFNIGGDAASVRNVKVTSLD